MTQKSCGSLETETTTHTGGNGYFPVWEVAGQDRSQVDGRM